MASSDRIVYYGIACTCASPKIRDPRGTGKMECVKCHARLEMLNIPVAGFESRNGVPDSVGAYIDGMSAEVSGIRIIMYRRMKELMFSFRRNPAEDAAPQAVGNPADAETIRRLEEENRALSAQMSRMKAEMQDLNSTISHFKVMNEKAASVDIHGAMGLISKYMCDVCKADSRKDTPEKIGRYLRNLTDTAIMGLEARGIAMTSEMPGAYVSGQVEVADRVPTDDPSLDGKVESNEQFGCRFQGDAFPRISNSVRIYSFKKDAKATAKHDQGYEDLDTMNVDPQLNNEALVYKGLNAIMMKLQDTVISGMKYRCGLDRWYEEMVSKVGNLPADAPRGHDATDDTAREFLDIPRLYAMLANRDLKLLPEERYDDIKHLLHKMVSIRNELVHSPASVCTAEKAREDLGALRELNDVLDLGAGEDMDRLIQAVMDDHPKNEDASVSGNRI